MKLGGIRTMLMSFVLANKREVCDQGMPLCWGRDSLRRDLIRSGTSKIISFLVWLMGLIYKPFCYPLQTSPNSSLRLGMIYIEKQNWSH